MRYVKMLGEGGPDVMAVCVGDKPKPREQEVQIEVVAAGVNRPDLVQRQGLYPPPEGASPVLGLEVAGVVSAVGAGVSQWQLGDQVCALVPGGGYAEYVVTPAAHCLPRPAGFSWAEAAALPETAFTVWCNLFMRAGLSAGDSLLVHGGSGGIGTMAIQLARAAGVRVMATAGDPDRVARCLALGADPAINYRDEDFVDVIRHATEGRGVDVILDMVGGDYLRRNQRVLAVEGRLVQIACMGGRSGELDIMTLMLKRQSVLGSTLRAQSDAAKAAIASGLRERAWPWIQAGEVRPVIDWIFDLEDVVKAHTLMESGGHFGKLVLKVRELPD